MRDEDLVASVSLGVSPGFGEVLFGAVETLLDSQALELADIDAYAAATGPGSFTGIRVGLVAFKALAEARGKPIAGISSLRALAFAAGGEGPRAALLDARRGELFCGCYGPEGEALAPEEVGSWDDLWPGLKALGGQLVANETHVFSPRGPAEQAPDVRRVTGPRDLAASVGLLALADLGRGLASPPEEIEANYIRRPGARLPVIKR